MSLEDDLATLALNIDSADTLPIYQQLANQIRQLIVSQRLAVGDRLPSSRKLASMLDLSRTTTLNAYDLLLAEGLLISRPASGIFVSTLSEGGSLKGERSGQPDPHCRHQGDEERVRGIFDAGPDVAQFPFPEWSRSLARVWRKPDPLLLRDRHEAGYWPLRQAVCRFVKAVRGIECSPEEVMITAGSRDAMGLLGRVLLGSDDRVALENPCYPPLRFGLQGVAKAIELCPVDSSGCTLPQTPVKMAWLTPARQYPLTVSMSVERRLQWLDFSHSIGSWLIEDDYDGEFHYRKTPQATLFNMAAQGYPPERRRVILLGSFSKLMFRTLRIGYLIAPANLVAELVEAQQRIGTLASVPVQPALADFLGNRRFSSHLRRMRRCYQQRRDFLYQILGSHLGNYLQPQLPEGGMHLVAEFNPYLAISDQWVEQQMAQQGIHALALSRHYQSTADQAVRQGLILGYSGSPEVDLQLGVERLGDCLQMNAKP